MSRGPYRGPRAIYLRMIYNQEKRQGVVEEVNISSLPNNLFGFFFFLTPLSQNFYFLKIFNLF